MKLSDGIKKVGKQYWLKIKTRSPEILMTIGIGSFIGSTVLACRATLKAQEVKDKYNENLVSIEDAKMIALENPDDEELAYTEKNAAMDSVVNKVHLVKDYAILYSPSIVLGIVGLVCICKSRNILQNRNLAVISAYNLLSKGFELYRSRVRQELGRDMDHHFRYGTEIEEDTITTLDEDGKKVKEKVIRHITKAGNVDGSVYSRVFNQTCTRNWSNNDDYNWTFLKAKQDYYNFCLMRDGVVFLNDVYEGLGFPKTRAGQVVGWSTKGTGDGVIDFGCKLLNERCTENGISARAILVDFNVDGVVYDQICMEI